MFAQAGIREIGQIRLITIPSLIKEITYNEKMDDFFCRTTFV
jgi:hypothetical protein